MVYVCAGPLSNAMYAHAMALLVTRVATYPGRDGQDR